MRSVRIGMCRVSRPTSTHPTIDELEVEAGEEVGWKRHDEYPTG
jgi:hypothetical protein